MSKARTAAYRGAMSGYRVPWPIAGRAACADSCASWGEPRLRNRAAMPTTKAKPRREHAWSNSALVPRRCSRREMLAGDCTALILVFAQLSLSLI